MKNYDWRNLSASITIYPCTPVISIDDLLSKKENEYIRACNSFFDAAREELTGMESLDGGSPS